MKKEICKICGNEDCHYDGVSITARWQHPIAPNRRDTATAELDKWARQNKKGCAGCGDFPCVCGEYMY